MTEHHHYYSNQLINSLSDLIEVVHSCGIPMEKIRFCPSDNPSPYREINTPSLNTIDFPPYMIPVNPLVRFGRLMGIVKEIADEHHYLLNLLFHWWVLIENNHGLDFSYFLNKITLKFINDGYLGTEGKMIIQRYTELTSSISADKFAGMIWNNYFNDIFPHGLYHVFRYLFPQGELYLQKNRNHQLIIYCGEVRSDLTTVKLDLLKYFFVPFEYSIQVCYEYRFGLIGRPSMMIIGKISIIA